MKTRTTTLGEVGDERAEPGTRPWAASLRLKVQGVLHDAEWNMNRIKSLTKLMDQHEGWRVLEDAKGRPFRSFEAFARYRRPWGLGIDDLPEQRQAVVLGKVGRPTKEEGENGRVTTISGDRGRTYLTARLRRDRPDLAEKVDRGEVSAHRAAIEAGFRRETVTVPKDLQAFVLAAVRLFGVDAVRAALEAVPALNQEAA